MRALLDVNVLLALQDEAHVHHGTAMQWLATHWDGGWASCPLTQNGCLRILSRPGHPNAQTPNAVRERLAEATAHEFLFQADDVLVLGSESSGAPPEVHAAVDAAIRLPMRPGARSLNVALAAAMTLGEALRQTGGLPLSPPVD